MTKIILVLVSLCLAAALPGPAPAGETGNCHCFRNRTYNPADRFVSDEYLLTTVFNSLIASYFSIEKRQIVMLKMKGGVLHDDLLIALFISRISGRDVTDLLAEKKGKTWLQVLTESRVNGQHRQDATYLLMLEGLEDGKAAEHITMAMLDGQFGLKEEAAASLMQQNFSLREIALMLTLAEHLRTDPDALSAQYRDRGHSWSEIAFNLGLQPSDVGKLAGGKDEKRQ